MAKHKRKTLMPWWQKLIIVVACVTVAICVVIGVSAIFRRAVIRQGTQINNQKYYSIIYVDERDTLLLADTITKDEKMKVAPTPKKDNYIFIGWNDGHKTYTTQELYSYTPDSDTTFKPVFKGEEYTLTIRNIEGAVIERRTVEIGKPIGDLPEVPAKEGYYIVWADISTDKRAFNVNKWDYAGDLEIKPYYQPLQWVVEYYVFAKDVPENILDDFKNDLHISFNFETSDDYLKYVRYIFGSTLRLPTKDLFVEEGYYSEYYIELFKGKTINGWLFNGERTNGVFTYDELKDLNYINLYADISYNTYTSTFIYNSQTYQVEQTYGEPIVFPAELPVEAGVRQWSYTYNGNTYNLYDNQERAYNFDTNMTFTFKALCTNTVTLDYNGADIGIEDTVMYVADNRSINLPIPGRYGYSFAGWQDADTGYMYEGYIRHYGPDEFYYDKPSMNHFYNRPDNKINVIATWSKETVQYKFIALYDYTYPTLCSQQEIATVNYYRGLPFGEFPTPPEIEGNNFLMWSRNIDYRTAEEFPPTEICKAEVGFTSTVYAIYTRAV